MDVTAELVSLSPKTYTVTFVDPEGGTPNPTSKTVTQGATYGTLATISKTGYNFDGWFTNDDIQITSSTVVNLTDDQTLYARWTPKSFTVTFYDAYSTPNPTSKTVTYGDTYGDLAQISRAGYNFDGWYT